MDKTTLRNRYKQQRNLLGTDEIEHGSIAIANTLLQLPIWDKSFYHLFLSIEKQKEVNTEFILNILQGKDKNVVLSKSDFKKNTLTHFLLTDTTKLAINPWGIPEPVDGIPIAEDQIEVVFVPLLAYDRLGNRVGYGKGFYDGFLSACRQETVKIGLSFFEPEKQIDGIFSGDIALDYCVTPKKVYDF